MKIDLGQKYDKGMCCSPSSTGDGKMSYPSLYFTHDKPVDLPDEGTAVITFRKVEAAEMQRNPDEPKKYRCEIEVHSIEPKGGKKKDDVDVGASFRKNLDRKMMKADEYEEGE